MPSFTVDISCMIAAVCSWHEHHSAALFEIERRLARGERLTVAAPAAVEAYAVLTRLPPPHRLAPVDAWALIKANFLQRRNVVALTAAAYCRMLQRLAGQSVAGGRAYDGVIAECARVAGVETLLTFNRRHFDPPPPGTAIVEPGGGPS